jgi:hypothetical protein
MEAGACRNLRTWSVEMGARCSGMAGLRYDGTWLVRAVIADASINVLRVAIIPATTPSEKPERPQPAVAAPIVAQDK